MYVYVCMYVYLNIEGASARVPPTPFLGGSAWVVALSRLVVA